MARSFAFWLLLGVVAGCQGILGIEEPVDLVAGASGKGGSAGAAMGGRASGEGGRGGRGGGSGGSLGGDAGQAGEAGAQPGGAGPEGGAGGAPDDLVGALQGLRTPEGITKDPGEPLTSTEQGNPDITNTDAVTNGVPIRTSVVVQEHSTSAIYEDQVLLRPTSRVIYPGAVLVGNTITTGGYEEVESGAKREVTISYRGLVARGGGSGAVTRSLRPSFNDYRSLHADVLAGGYEGAGDDYTLTLSEISTESAFDLHFSQNVSFPFVTGANTVKGTMDFGQVSLARRYLARFVQTYYTVELEHEPGRILYEAFEIDDFEGYRPIYVSSVSYGRLGHLTFESTAPAATLEEGLRAIFDDPSLVSEASPPSEVTAVKDATDLRVTLVGSDTELTTLEDFSDYLSNGGFSATDTGEIVAYTLRFVDDGSPANVIHESGYTRRIMSEHVGDFDVELEIVSITYGSTDAIGMMPEVVGRVLATAGGEDCFLFDHTGTDGVPAYESGQLTPVAELPCSFSLASLSDVVDFSVTGVRELDDFMVHDEYNNVTQNDVLLSSLAVESEPGTYGGFRTIRSTGLSGQSSDYVDFRIQSTAVARYPSE